MNRKLEISTAAVTKRLTTVERVRDDLNLPATATEPDEFIEGLIDTASDLISGYINYDADETDQITIGRETVAETFYDALGKRELLLGRAPVGDITSVTETSSATARILNYTDGAIDIGVSDTTLTSASAPFLAAHVGDSITITGAGDAGVDLTTTIASFTDNSTVEIATPATTTVAAASFSLENQAFVAGFDVKKSGGILWKLSGGIPTPFAVNKVVVIYSCGWILPGQTGRTLPQDIEDAAVMLVRRKFEQLREGDVTPTGRLVKSESLVGIGSWTYEVGDRSMQDGLPSDVRNMISRYVRPAVSV